MKKLGELGLIACLLLTGCCLSRSAQNFESGSCQSEACGAIAPKTFAPPPVYEEKIVTQVGHQLEIGINYDDFQVEADKIKRGSQPKTMIADNCAGGIPKTVNPGSPTRVPFRLTGEILISHGQPAMTKSMVRKTVKQPCNTGHKGTCVPGVCAPNCDAPGPAGIDAVPLGDDPGPASDLPSTIAPAPPEDGSGPASDPPDPEDAGSTTSGDTARLFPRPYEFRSVTE